MSFKSRTLFLLCSSVILSYHVMDRPALAQTNSAQTAVIGQGTHFQHFTETGTNCGQPVSADSTSTSFYSDLLLLPSLPLIKVGNSWVPATVSTTGQSPDFSLQTSRTSTIDEAGLITTTEQGEAQYKVADLHTRHLQLRKR